MNDFTTQEIPTNYNKKTAISKYRIQNPQYEDFSDDEIRKAVYEHKYKSAGYNFDEFNSAFDEAYGDIKTPKEEKQNIDNDWLGAIVPSQNPMYPLTFRGGLVQNALNRGVLGVLDNIASVISYATEEPVEGQDVLKSWIKEIPVSEIASKPFDEDPVGHIFNLKWWAGMGAEAAPMLAGYVAIGAVVGLAGVETAGVLGAGLLTARAVGIAGTILGPAIGMSLNDAGTAYTTAIDQEKPEEEANDIATNIFASSMAINTVANAFLVGRGMKALGILPKSETIKKAATSILKEAGVLSGVLGMQSSIQTIIANGAFGKSDIFEGVAEAGVSGAGLGVAMGVGFGIMGKVGKTPKTKITESIIKNAEKVLDAEGKILPDAIKDATKEYGELTPDQVRGRIDDIINTVTLDGDPTKKAEIQEIFAKIKATGVPDHVVLGILENMYKDVVADAQIQSTIDDAVAEKQPKSIVDSIVDVEDTKVKTRVGELHDKVTNNTATLDEFTEYESLVGKPVVSSPTGETVSIMMKLKDINTEFQHDVPNSMHEVEDIMRRIQAGEKIPPIIVSKNGYLLNGRHRLEAYRRLGIEDIPVEIEKPKATPPEVLSDFDKKIAEVQNNKDLSPEAKKQAVKLLEKNKHQFEVDEANRKVGIIENAVSEPVLVREVLHRMASAHKMTMVDFVNSRLHDVTADIPPAELVKKLNQMSPEFQAWTEGKQTEVLFHASPVDITGFDASKSGLGTHLGTIDQAQDIVTYKMGVGGGWRFDSDGVLRKKMPDGWTAEEKPNLRVPISIYKVIAKIGKSVSTVDVGMWDLPNSVHVGLQKSSLSDMVKKRLGDIYSKFSDEYSSLALGHYIEKDRAEFKEEHYFSKVRKELKDAGYDSIKYQNQSEGISFGPEGEPKPNYSYVMLDDTNVKSVWNRGKFSKLNDLLEQGGAKPRGVAEIYEDGKQILRLFTKESKEYKPSDMSTFLHEMFHLNEKYLGGEHLKSMEEYVGKTKVEWGVAEKEKLASAWEKYWYDGEAPNSKLAKLFFEIKQRMISLYRGISEIEGIKISEPLRKAFDSLIEVEAKKSLKQSTQTGTFTQSTPTQEDILRNNKPLGLNRKFGTVEDVKPDELNTMISDIHSIGYKVPIDENGNPRVIVHPDGTLEVPYVMPKHDKTKVDRLIQARAREVSGNGTLKSAEVLGEAFGYSPEERQAYRNSWMERVDRVLAESEDIERQVPKLPRGQSGNILKSKKDWIKSSGITPEQYKEWKDANLTEEQRQTLEIQQEFGVEVTAPRLGGSKDRLAKLAGMAEGTGEEAGGQAENAGFRVRQNQAFVNEAVFSDIARSNSSLARMMKSAYETGDTKLGDLLGSLIKDTHTDPNTFLEKFGAREAKIAAKTDVFDSLISLDAINRVLRVSTNADERAKLLQLYSIYDEKLKTPEAKRILDVVMHDPEYTAFDTSMAMSEAERLSYYDELKLTKDAGDKFSNDELGGMIDSKYAALNMFGDGEIFQQSVRVREDISGFQKVFDLFPEKEKNLLIGMGLSPKEIRMTIRKVGQVLDTQQGLARFSPNDYAKVLRMTIANVRQADQLRTAIGENENVVKAKMLPKPERDQIANILKKGTLYREAEKIATKPNPKPWEQSDWVDKPHLDKLPEEMADATRKKQDKQRAVWARQEVINRAQSAVDYMKRGKVFSREELKAEGNSEGVINGYFAIRDAVDVLTGLSKDTARMRGASVPDAEMAYSMTGYFPTSQQRGEWIFSYRDPDFRTGKGVARFESYTKAKATWDALVKEGKIDPSKSQGPDKIEKFISAHGLRELPLYELVNLIESAGIDRTTPEVKALLDQAKKQHKATQYLISRGDSGLLMDGDDMVKMFDDLVGSTTRRYVKALTEAQMDANINSMVDVQWQNFARQYMNSTFSAEAFNPKTKKFFDIVRRGGFVSALAGNMKQAIINLIQSYNSAIYLHEKIWGMAGKVHNAWLPALEGGISSAFRTEKLPDGRVITKLPESLTKKYPRLQEAFEEWKSRGVVSATYNEEIWNAKLDKEKWMHSASILQSKGEKVNRGVSTIVGYIAAQDYIIDNAKGNMALANRMADIVGLTHQESRDIALDTKIPMEKRGEAYLAKIGEKRTKFYEGTLTPEERHIAGVQFGQEVSDVTQFVYGKHTLPKLIQSAGILREPLRAGFLFKSFNLNQVSFLLSSIRNEGDGSFARGLMTPHALVTLGPLVLMAGMKGLPFASNLLEILKGAGLSDPETWLREAINNTDVSNMILTGMSTILPNEIAFEMSRSAGIGDILPKGVDKLAGGDMRGAAEMLEDMFGGAPLSMISRATDGIAMLKAGDVTQGMKQILPVFAQNLIKALEYNDTGAKTSKGQLLATPEEVGGFPRTALTAMGFKPLVVSMREQREQAMRYIDDKRKSMTAYFNSRIVNARIDNDVEELKQIRLDIVKYNTGVEPSLRYRIKNNIPTIKHRLQLGMNENAGMTKYTKAMRPEYLRMKNLYGEGVTSEQRNIQSAVEQAKAQLTQPAAPPNLQAFPPQQ